MSPWFPLLPTELDFDMAATVELRVAITIGDNIMQGSTAIPSVIYAICNPWWIVTPKGSNITLLAIGVALGWEFQPSMSPGIDLVSSFPQEPNQHAWLGYSDLPPLVILALWSHTSRLDYKVNIVRQGIANALRASLMNVRLTPSVHFPQNQDFFIQWCHSYP